MKNMKDDILKVLLSEEEIAVKVQEIGAQITKDYQNKNLLMVSVLKGSVVFMADLMRAVDCHARIDFMSVSSYGNGTKTSGVVKIVKDLDLNLEGYDLLLVEDILDSGKTLYYLREILKERNPASIRIATLLNKPARREADITPDYSCFEVPDEFVVGYGLDFAEKYRNLPYIGVLKPEVYTK
jgi:hypoxanthine phosphoribosyltransferase